MNEIGAYRVGMKVDVDFPAKPGVSNRGVVRAVGPDGCFVRLDGGHVPSFWAFDKLSPAAPGAPGETWGLTEQEKATLGHLAAAWNAFNLCVENGIPQDYMDFMNGIHDAQKVIALRVARRVNPEVWSKAPEAE